MNSIDKFIEVFNKEYIRKPVSGRIVDSIVKRNACSRAIDTVEYFLNCFDFPKTGNWMTLYFDRDYKPLPERYVHFASDGDNNMLYVYDKIGGAVFYWDSEEDSLYWPCAVSIPAFFESMTIVLRTFIRNRESNWSLDIEERRSAFQKCLELNGGRKEFSEFYEHLLDIE